MKEIEIWGGRKVLKQNHTSKQHHFGEIPSGLQLAHSRGPTPNCAHLYANGCSYLPQTGVERGVADGFDVVARRPPQPKTKMKAKFLENKMTRTTISTDITTQLGMMGTGLCHTLCHLELEDFWLWCVHHTKLSVFIRPLKNYFK